MKMRFRQTLCLSILLALSCTTAALALEDIFADYSLEQAKKQAQTDKKLLLIDFTATWCPPCKMMESTTWKDESVKTWIKNNAVAIQIDVDRDRKSTSALSVEAMPTLVLFTADGSNEEFGRKVGYMSPSELIQWLEGAKSGKSAAELESHQADVNEVWTHLGKARALQGSGKNEEALEEYLWIWTHISKSDPNVGEVRASQVPMEMKRICAVLPQAKAKITELREAADKSNNRQDWITLNAVLNEDDKTWLWFDKTKTDPKQRDTIKGCAALLEPVLFSKCKWDDAATYLYPDPLAKINEYYKRAQDMKKPRPDTEFAKDFDPFPPMVLLVYGAYVGAKRDDVAQKIYDECVRLDDTPVMREGLNSMGTAMRKARVGQNTPK
ncbi:MAG: thioredoxin family protein [Cyanobacteria bacterium]|nr:thioredoxin family protein [Cyanobacteriota bacterium]